jgi:hypothetical protein
MSAAPMKWFNNPKFDIPALNSPQPCIHGAGCVYTVKDVDGTVKPGCCRYVHPGEEGTGRRLFPQRTLSDGSVQPACVRLTGAAHQFYERRGRKIPWQEWCRLQEIPFTPNKPGEKHEPVQKVGFGGKKTRVAAEATPSCPPCSAVIPPPALNLFSPSLQRRGLRTTLFRTGECSPDCSCLYGTMCGDRSDHPDHCGVISCQELEAGLINAANCIPTPSIPRGGLTGVAAAAASAAASAASAAASAASATVASAAAATATAAAAAALATLQNNGARAPQLPQGDDNDEESACTTPGLSSASASPEGGATPELGSFETGIEYENLD